MGTYIFLVMIPGSVADQVRLQFEAGQPITIITFVYGFCRGILS